MKRVTIAGIALAALAFGLAGAGIQAGDKKEKTKLPAGAIDDDVLKDRLENLGYEPKPSKSTAGSAMYLLDFERDNFRYVFYVSLSSDKSRLWMSAALRKLPDAKDVRKDILEKILLKNDEIGPTHFTLRKNRFLYLELALDNRDLTSKRLRKEIDEFSVNLRNTQSLWDPTKYPKVEDSKPEK